MSSVVADDLPDEDREARRGRQARSVLLASAISTVSISPGFLVGGLAVQINAELGLGPATLGLAISLFFAATSLSSAFLGRLVQRAGVRRGLCGVMLLHSIGLAGIGTARSLTQLAGCLAFCGVANGAVHPAANVLLVNGVRDRLALAMGIKQAAMPAATMAAGLAVPVIALTVGWRWTFALAIVVALSLFSVALGLDRDLTGPGGAAPSSVVFPRRSLVVMAVGAALGSMAGNSLGTFLVDAGVTMVGLAEGTAGLVSAVASSVALCSRVFFGWQVDRGPRLGPYGTSAGLLAAGSFGYLLIAGQRPALFVSGALLAFGAGWAWPGLVSYAVVHRAGDGAAQATGTLMTGFAGGSFLGPLILGQVASAYGYPVLWTSMVALSLCSGAVILFASRLMGRPAPREDRPRPATLRAAP